MASSRVTSGELGLHSSSVGELGVPLELYQGSWASSRVAVGQVLSSSDMKVCLCLVAMCRKLLSSCSIDLYSNCSEGLLYLWTVGSSLAVVCRLLSSFGGEVGRAHL